MQTRKTGYALEAVFAGRASPAELLERWNPLVDEPHRARTVRIRTERNARCIHALIERLLARADVQRGVSRSRDLPKPLPLPEL